MDGFLLCGYGKILLGSFTLAIELWMVLLCGYGKILLGSFTLAIELWMVLLCGYGKILLGSFTLAIELWMVNTNENLNENLFLKVAFIYLIRIFLTFLFC
jgi:hypothetical protein